MKASEGQTSGGKCRLSDRRGCGSLKKRTQLFFVYLDGGIDEPEPWGLEGK